MKINVLGKDVKILKNGMYEVTLNEDDAGWVSREYILDQIFDDVKTRLDQLGYTEQHDFEDWEIDEISLDVYEMVRYQSGEDRETVSVDMAITNYLSQG